MSLWLLVQCHSIYLNLNHGLLLLQHRETMPILRTTALIILVLFTLLGWACWLYAEQILNELVRPQIEQAITQQLAAEVKIASMAWTEDGLRVNSLSIQRSDDLLLTVSQLEIDFTFAGLWQRRLDKVQLIAPQLRIAPAKDKPVSGKSPAALPDKFPLSIGSLTLVNGDLLLQLAERQIRIREIDFSAALDADLPFKLSALIGESDSQAITVNGRLKLAPQATLDLENIQLNAQSLLAKPLSLSVSSAGLEQGGGTLQVGHFDQQQLRNILTALGESYPLPEDLLFSLQETEIALSLAEKSLSARIKVAAGLLAINDLSVPFNLNNLELTREAANWLAEGKLSGPAGLKLSFIARQEGADLIGKANIEVPQPDRLKTELLGGPPLGLAGSLQLAVDYALADKKLQASAVIRGQAATRPENYRVNLAQLSGELTVQVDNQQEKLSLKLQQNQHSLLSATGDLQSFTFQLSLPDRKQLAGLLAPELLPEQLKAFANLTAAGHLSSNKQKTWQGEIELKVQNAELAVFNFKGIRLEGQLQLAAGRLKASAVRLTAAADQGDNLSAKISAQLAGELSAERFQITLHKLGLSEFNYLSSSGQHGLGNGRASLTGLLQGHFPLQRIELEISASAAADELLSGEIYADLSTLTSQLSLAGHLSPANQSLIARSLEITIPTIGTANGNGQFNPEQVIFHASAEFNDLAATYAKHIGPLLTELRPRTADLRVAGRLAIDTELRWAPAGWLVSGQIRPQGLDAVWDFYGLEMADGKGRIPYAVQQGRPVGLADDQMELSGEISFATLALGLASLDAGSLQLAAEPNRFAFRSPLRLQLAGGQVAIDQLAFGWDQGGPHGSVRIGISDVDLAGLTQELGWPLMQGQFSADLGLLRYSDQQLTSQGSARLEVFGGRFQLRNMRYSEPFSRYPIFHVDIDFSDLDLLQATRTFEFGEMNGVVDGFLHNLRLFGTTPSAFKAQLSTRSKGKRNISVKALQNLSIISQGGISAALTQGIYRFIDFYRYQKIGFECSLENDIFTLIGTARSDSQRYLVYGGLMPPRIDITTTSPTISFKEMVARLSRIERTGN